MEDETRAANGRDQACVPLPPVVRRLGWISFCTDVASEMVYPVVPLFLASVLGAPAAALGLIEGVAEALVSVMKGYSGISSDRTGRRVPLIRLGYGLGAASKPMLAAAFIWPLVLLARLVDRLGKGLRSAARDALVADAAPACSRGRAYGFNRMMDTFGAMTGALACVGLLWLLPGAYRTIFLLATIPGLVTVWLTFGLREADPQQEGQGDRERAPHPGLCQVLSGLSPAYWRALAPLALFALANSSDAFLLLRARGLGLGDAQVVLAYALFNLIYAVSVYPLGALSDRLGRWPLLAAGWAVYAGVYLCLGLGMGEMTAGDVWWLLAVYGLYMGCTDGAGRALMAGRAGEGARGAAIGLFQMAVGLMTLTGSVLAGALWDAFGPAWAFRLGGCAALAALLLLALLRPWRDAAGA